MTLKQYLTVVVFITAAVTLSMPVYAKQLVFPVVESTIARLQAVQQGNAIQLFWLDVPGSDGYRIYHEQGNNLLPGSTWIDIDNSQCFYLYSGVTDGMTYSFRVTPLDGKQEGIGSAIVTVTVPQKAASKKSDVGK